MDNLYLDKKWSDLSALEQQKFKQTFDEKPQNRRESNRRETTRRVATSMSSES